MFGILANYLTRQLANKRYGVGYHCVLQGMDQSIRTDPVVLEGSETNNFTSAASFTHWDTGRYTVVIPGCLSIERTRVYVVCRQLGVVTHFSALAIDDSTIQIAIWDESNEPYDPSSIQLDIINYPS